MLESTKPTESGELDFTPFLDVIRGRHFPVSIWSDSETRDFVLLDPAAHARGESERLPHHKFLGAIALDEEGIAHSALTEPLKADAIAALAAAYVQHLESNFRHVLNLPEATTAHRTHNA